MVREERESGREAGGLGRREFLARSVAVGVGVAAAAGELRAGRPGEAAGAFEFEEATIARLSRAMEEGKLTARVLAQSYIERIEGVDRNGPALNSVIELNPDALAIADALDAERRSKGARGPLHGIPVLVKDNIDTADRMKTSAGSLALADSTPPADATVAARLRAAGAVILGKTNLSEWANFRSTRSTSGWSGRGGQTKNPYALDRNPCGSSSGSGAAISANLAAAAIGTETDGSIVCPSHNNGIVGIKPTLGLVSRAGIIPIAASQDTAGPMCRTVADAAIVLAAIAGVDPRDAATARHSTAAPLDWRTALEPGGFKGARIGVARNPGFAGGHPGVEKVFEEALHAIAAAGATLVDPASIPRVGEYDDAELEVLLYEFKDGLNVYLASLGPAARVKTLAELIRFNEENREREMPFFGQELFLKTQEKSPLTDKAYRKARAKCVRLSRADGLDAVLGRLRLDAVVAPTGGPAWVTDLVNGDHFGGGSSTPAAVAGYPSITVPAGAVFGLPVGVSFIGAPWSETRLIRLASAFEQATNARRTPRLLPTLPLSP